MKKKFLALFLALAVIISLSPVVSVGAQEEKGWREGWNVVKEDLEGPDYIQPPQHYKTLDMMLAEAGMGEYSGPPPVAVSGTRELLVILAQLSDATPDVTHTNSYFTDRFFDTAPPSVRDYYTEVSYGNFTYVPGAVMGWYSSAFSQAQWNTNPRPVVEEAIQWADGTFDFSTFDTSGNGTVTNDELTIFIIVSGSVGGAFHWWTTSPVATGDGVNVEGEFSATHEGQHIGSYVHELGHDLGLPDLYDTDVDITGDSNGIGNYGLMGTGSWTFSHMTAWSKIQLGWITPTIITTDGYYNVRDAETNAEAYVLVDPAHSTNEYFLVENRYPANSYYETVGPPVAPGGTFPDTGIVIYHIDETKMEAWIFAGINNVNVDETHKGVDVETAEHPTSHTINADDLDAGVNRGDADDLWDINEYDFHDTSTPCNANWYVTTPSNMFVGNFPAATDTMTVYFSHTVPDIWVDPTGGFNVTLPPGGTWSDTLTIGNDGDAALTYDITDQETTPAPPPAPPPPPPGSAEVIEHEHKIQLIPSEPISFPPLLNIPYEIAYDDGVAEDAYVWPLAGNGFAVRFTPPSYPVDLDIARIGLWPGGWPDSDHEQFAVEIYDDDGPGGAPNSLLGSVNTTATNWGWWDVDISSLNITITSGDFYIAYIQLGDSPDCEGLCYDESAPDGRSWDYYDGEWSLWPYEDYMIRCIVDLPDCPWLDESPTSGSVAPGNSDAITVSIDTAGLALGDYSGNIFISNNDPDENPTIVPVNLSVATTAANTPPVLSNGQVSPATGDVATEFTYSVTYTDADNDPPASPTVSIDSGLPQDMTVKAGEDGDYTNGEVYEYATSGLSKGSHNFQFAATDGVDDATGDTGVHTGPTVQNSPPSVGSVSISPDPAYSDTGLTATPSGWSDPDGDTEGYQWQWQKWDGDSWEDISGANTNTLASSNFVGSDQIKVICTPYDGTDTGSPVEATITISNSPPFLSNGGVSPETGDMTTEFTYSVTYTDTDNDPPASPTVSIDGGLPQDMTVKAGEDGDYTNGEVYEYSTSGLSKGSHNFQFAATDGVDDATGDIGIHAGPGVENTPPVLSNGQVSPETGDVATEFTYSVTYTDADNDSPASPTVSIDGGLPQDMTVKAGEDGDYTNGEVYEYATSGLSKGSHNFQFAATDGVDDATGDTGVHTGPTVQNSPPSVGSVSISPDPAYSDTGLTATPSGWSDPDGDTEGYQWQWQKWDGDSWEDISGANTNTLASSNFVKGDQIKIICTPYDGTDTGSPVEATITISNSPPVANAGPDQRALINTLITLDGSGSSDIDDDPLTYLWSQTGGITVTLSDSTAVNATFTPTEADTYTFSLVVNDGTDDSLSDMVVLTVKASNVAPVLSDGTVNPASGYASTTFTYSVVYTDDDNDSPMSITIAIDAGTPQDMSVKAGEDGDYTNGEMYEYTASGADLGLGSHNFQFAASDGIDDATGDTDIHDEPSVRSRPSGGGGVGRPDTRPPTISSIECSDCTKTSIIIKWKTNERSSSKVEYWASKHQFSPLDETMVIYHEAELTNLNPCCIYHFRAISKDRYDNEAISEEHTFTTLGTPAAFAVSALSISPAEVEIGESVTISVLVTNTGDGCGTYKVTLELDELAVVAKEVTLAGGASQKLTFTTSKDVEGTYRVDIADLSGMVVVVAAPPTPTPTPVPAPTPPPGTPPTPEAAINWWLIGVIIAGCVVAGLAVYFLVWRRRGTSRSA